MPDLDEALAKFLPMVEDGLAKILTAMTPEDEEEDKEEAAEGGEN